ncbi:transposase [Sulfurimonas sp.]
MSNSKYTEEFRTSTVQLIINSNRSVREVSEDLGVHEKTLYSWIRAVPLPKN